MKEDFSRDLILQVKTQAKFLGLTQAQLAKRLGVSLPTMKRWYQGDFVTLENLKRLCDEVGLSLAEVFASVESKGSQRFQYTLEQESFFSQNPAALAYFDLLLKALSARAIEKRASITSQKSARILAQLEKLKLLNWLKGDRIQLLIEGEPVWRKDGPLAKTFGPLIREGFLNSLKPGESRFLLHSYLPDDLATLKMKLEELVNFASTANKRAKRHSGSARAYGLMINLGAYEWNLEAQLKK